MEPQRRVDRIHIPVEQPLKAAFVTVNHTLPWAILCIVVTFFMMWRVAGAGDFLTAMVVIIGVWTAYIVLFLTEYEGTTPSARMFRWAYRNAMRLSGRAEQAPEAVLRGYYFGSEAPVHEIAELAPKWGRAKPPRWMGGVNIIPYELPAEDGQGPILGINQDLLHNTISASMRVSGTSLLGADPELRQDWLSGFAAILDHVAENQQRVYRFSWRVQTLPGEHADPIGAISRLRHAGGLSDYSRPGEDEYASQVRGIAAGIPEYRVTFTITTHRKRAQREARKWGGDPVGVLVQELETLHNLAIESEDDPSPIGLSSGRFLTYNDAVLANLLAVDPVYAQMLVQQWQRPEDRTQLLPEALAWPDYSYYPTTKNEQDYILMGQTFHSGWYVKAFPPAGMPLDDFWRILRLDLPMTFTGIYDMLPPNKGERSQRLRTSSVHSRNIAKASSPRRVTSFDTRAEERELELEDELADHTGQLGRMRVYIDLHGKSREEVTDYGVRLNNAAMNTRIVLAPLLGGQHLGIAASVMFGRGLETLK